jgi:hypothetical protein
LGRKRETSQRTLSENGKIEEEARLAEEQEKKKKRDTMLLAALVVMATFDSYENQRTQNN